MAKVLILYAGKGKHLKDFAQAAKKRHLEAKIARYSQLNFRSNQPGLYIDDDDLKSFALIYLRLVGTHREELTLIADYANQHQIPLVDKILHTGSIDRKKSFEIKKLVEAGLPYPRTVYASLKQLKKTAALELNFPFILKRTDGKQGRNVYLTKGQGELDALVKKLLPEEEEGRRFMAQEFIPNDGDLRIIVIGGKVLGSIKRTPQKKGEFRSNVSLGGKAEAIKAGGDLEKLAVKTAEICQIDFAGVDIILDKNTQEPYILEINRAPQYAGFSKATRINVPLAVIDYLGEQIGHGR